MKIEGARILITGCSSGIGRQCALALARAGAAVFASARDLGPLEALRPVGIATLELDVCDPTAVERAITAVGAIDVLVNNAGYGLEGAVEEVADDELRLQFETNVFAPWRLCRAVLPQMRERGGGAIVNVSSFGGQAPFPGIGAYRSSKFALEGMTWTLHLEVAHFGIRVISVQPGLVDTDFGTRSLRRARARLSAYDDMRTSADVAYAKMSPQALSPEAVADRIVAELGRDSGPLHVRIGADAERMTAAIMSGDVAYERLLVEELGLSWHHRPSSDRA